MTNSELDRLAASKYLSLTTFKKDGTPVASPVWLAREGAQLYVITQRDSWKVKRLRRNPQVLLAPSDMRGGLRGAQVAGSAQVLDGPADIERVRGLLSRRYGLQWKIARLAEKVRPRGEQVGLRIEVSAAPAAA